MDGVKPILKGKKVKTRILRPSEYHLLRSQLSYSNTPQVLLDTCLLLGARYEECRAIQNHREWFDCYFINLPSEAQRKVKQRQSERSIRLSLKAKTLMPFFFAARQLPTPQAMNRNLKRWAEEAGLDPIGLSYC